MRSFCMHGTKAPYKDIRECDVALVFQGTHGGCAHRHASRVTGKSDAFVHGNDDGMMAEDGVGKKKLWLF